MEQKEKGKQTQLDSYAINNHQHCEHAKKIHRSTESICWIKMLHVCKDTFAIRIEVNRFECKWSKNRLQIDTIYLLNVDINFMCKKTRNVAEMCEARRIGKMIPGTRKCEWEKEKKEDSVTAKVKSRSFLNGKAIVIVDSGRWMQNMRNRVCVYACMHTWVYVCVCVWDADQSALIQMARTQAFHSFVKCEIKFGK